MASVFVDAHGNQWLDGETKLHVYRLAAWQRFLTAYPAQAGAYPGHTRIPASWVDRLCKLVDTTNRAVEGADDRRSYTSQYELRRHGRADHRETPRAVIIHPAAVCDFGDTSESAAIVLAKRAVLGFLGIPLGAIHPVIACGERAYAQLLLAIDTERGDLIVTAKNPGVYRVSHCAELLFAPDYAPLAYPHWQPEPVSAAV